MEKDFVSAYVCETCERLTRAFKDKCHYVNCPHRDKSKMPVPVKKRELRTLWVLPATPSTSEAHKPFEDFFNGTMLLQPHSVISENDVVFFDGGTDVNPELYGEMPHIATGKPDTERDERERHAFKRAQAAGASCLGVCRGAQFLVVMSGGKLIQHVEGHYGGGHLIVTYAEQCIFSESSHHQVMWPNEIPHVKLAWALDRAQQPFVASDEYGKTLFDGEYPEIVYCKDTRSLCIQGHTEWMPKDSAFAVLTRDLVKEFLIEGR